MAAPESMEKIHDTADPSIEDENRHEDNATATAVAPDVSTLSTRPAGSASRKNVSTDLSQLQTGSAMSTGLSHHHDPLGMSVTRVPEPQQPFLSADTKDVHDPSRQTSSDLGAQSSLAEQQPGFLPLPPSGTDYYETIETGINEPAFMLPWQGDQSQPKASESFHGGLNYQPDAQGSGLYSSYYPQYPYLAQPYWYPYYYGYSNSYPASYALPYRDHGSEQLSTGYFARPVDPASHADAGSPVASSEGAEPGKLAHSQSSKFLAPTVEEYHSTEGEEHTVSPFKDSTKLKNLSTKRKKNVFQGPSRSTPTVKTVRSIETERKKKWKSHASQAFYCSPVQDAASPPAFASTPPLWAPAVPRKTPPPVYGPTVSANRGYNNASLEEAAEKEPREPLRGSTTNVTPGIHATHAAGKGTPPLRKAQALDATSETLIIPVSVQCSHATLHSLFSTFLHSNWPERAERLDDGYVTVRKATSAKRSKKRDGSISIELGCDTGPSPIESKNTHQVQWL